MSEIIWHIGYTEIIIGVEEDNEVAKHIYFKFGFNIDGIAMFSKDWKKDLEE